MAQAKKKKRLSSLFFIEYLFVLILILDANTIWTSYEESPLSRILKVALVLVGIWYIVAQKHLLSKAIQNIALSLGLGLLYIIFYASALGYKTRGFVFLVCTAIAVYSFVQIANSKGRAHGLFLKYSSIIFVVAVVSMFFWLFGSTLGIISPTGVEYTTWGAQDMASGVKAIPSYFGVYFETQSAESIVGNAGKMIRNTAIFTEAPMCNFHFCLALLIEMFYNPKTSRIKCILLIVAILTTISTTGYCMLAIALACKYLTSAKSKSWMRVILMLCVPVVLIAAALAFRYLIEAKLDTGSGIDRARDFVVGFRAWNNSPIFGYGYHKPFYYLNLHYGFSNSITPILGSGGLFLASPYLYCMFMWARTCIRERDMQKFLLFAMFFFIFTITIMSFKFLSFFLFFAYCVKRPSAEPVPSRVVQHKVPATMQPAAVVLD